MSRYRWHYATSRADTPPPAAQPQRVRERPAPLDNQTAQAHQALTFGQSHDREESRADAQAERFVARFAGATPGLRDYERFFGRALSGVRIHTGAASQRAATALGARAFAHGRDIHFAAGQFDLRSRPGQRLLAHELSHIGRDRGEGRTIRRQDDPNAKRDGPAFSVQTMSLAEFTRQTGVDPANLSEKRYVPMSVLLRSVALGMSCPAPIRMTNLPLNTTGVGWEGAHAWDFAIVNGKLVNTRGFRADLFRHIISSGERGLPQVFDPIGRLLYGRGGATATLNSGVGGSYASDWMFPFNPKASVVYRTDPATDPAGFADYMNASKPEFVGQQYTFSPPKQGSQAWIDAYGAEGKPPPTTNCINLPAEQHRKALGLGPDDPLPFVPEPDAPGRFLDPADDFFFGKGEPGPGLARARIGPAMLAGGAIKVGGTVLLVYGAVNTATRIADAKPGAETRMVVSEETGAWTGGLIGSVLAEALGAAFVCTGTGPGAFFCLAGFGLAGGLLGGTAGHSLGHDVGEQLNNAVDILKSPAKMTEAASVIHSAVTGSDSAQQYYKMREAEGGEPSWWPF